MPKHVAPKEVVAKARAEAFGTHSSAPGPWRKLKETFRQAAKEGRTDSRFVKHNPAWKVEFIFDAANMAQFWRAVDPALPEPDAAPLREDLLARYAALASQHTTGSSIAVATAEAQAAKERHAALNRRQEAEAAARAAARAAAKGGTASSSHEPPAGASSSAPAPAPKSRPRPPGPPDAPARRPRL